MKSIFSLMAEVFDFTVEKWVGYTDNMGGTLTPASQIPDSIIDAIYVVSDL